MKRHLGGGLGVSQVQELLSPWSWGVSSSQYLDVFTYLDSLYPALQRFIQRLHPVTGKS